jgi:hypothetical protein
LHQEENDSHANFSLYGFLSHHRSGSKTETKRGRPKEKCIQQLKHLQKEKYGMEGKVGGH